VLGKTLAATLAFVISCAGGPVQAAEVKVLCASGMREIVSDLQPQLRQAASAEMSVSFGEAGACESASREARSLTSQYCRESFSTK
jgi:ABC-type molybdate transport system substrate-binding protein